MPPRQPRFRSWLLPWIATTLGAVVVFLLLVLIYPRALVTPDLSPAPVELWTEKLGGIPWGQGSFTTLARREPDLGAAPLGTRQAAPCEWPTRCKYGAGGQPGGDGLVSDPVYGARGASER